MLEVRQLGVGVQARLRGEFLAVVHCDHHVGVRGPGSRGQIDGETLLTGEAWGIDFEDFWDRCGFMSIPAPNPYSLLESVLEH